MDDQNKGYAYLLAASLIAGSIGIIVRSIAGLDAPSILFARAAIASTFLLAAVFVCGRIKNLKVIEPVNTLKLGIFYGTSTLLSFEAILHTSISNAYLLLYTAPLFSILFAKVFLKEKIERKTLAGALVILTGITLVLDPSTISLQSSQTLGNLAALASAALTAATTVTAKPLLKKTASFYLVFWQYAITAAMLVFFAKIGSPAVLFQNWWQLIALGLLASIGMYLLFFEGVKKVKTQQVLVITSFEVLIAILLAMLVLAEYPPILTVIGGAAILAGIYLTTRK